MKNSASPLRGKKVAVLLEKQYEDLEFWYPKFRLQEEGAEVIIVAPDKNKEYPSKHEYLAKSTHAATDVKASDIDGVIIPGGYSPDHMRQNAAMVNLVGDAVKSGKIVAAICHGGWMLCSAKVLKDRQATSYIAIKDDMENAGAKWIDRECVRDENIITSRKPDDLPAFMKTFIGAFID